MLLLFREERQVARVVNRKNEGKSKTKERKEEKNSNSFRFRSINATPPPPPPASVTLAAYRCKSGALRCCYFCYRPITTPRAFALLRHERRVLYQGEYTRIRARQLRPGRDKKCDLPRPRRDTMRVCWSFREQRFNTYVEG